MNVLGRSIALLRFFWIRDWKRRFSLVALLLILFLFTELVLGENANMHLVSRTVSFRLPIPEKLAGKLDIPPNPAIEKIIVTGFFSGWNPSDNFFRMRKKGLGVWERKLIVLPGDTQYKFVLYLKGRKHPVWIHDFRSELRVNDSYGGFNSLIRIPRSGELYYLIRALLKILLTAVLLFFVLEPFFFMILHLKIPFRFKLLTILLAAMLVSNIVTIKYNLHEARALVRQTVVESCNLVHLSLLGNGVDFKHLDRDREKAGKTLAVIFNRALTRVEKNTRDNRQITLSDLALFDRNGRLVALADRNQNRKQLADRARRYGFADIKSYFIKGLFKSFAKRMVNRDALKTQFLPPPKRLLRFETDKTRKSVGTLGFKMFLHPIIKRSQVIGYYAGLIQTKMFADELNRIFRFNLFLLVAVLFFSFFLLLGLGKVVSRYLDDLTGRTRELIDGNFSASPLIRTGDEFEELSRNFNSMRATLRDNIRKIEENNRLLQMEAYLDSLTCLPNRRKLSIELDQIPCNAMMIVNIDSFRGINDFFGNDVGDFIIKEMASRLLSHLEGDRTGLYKLEADEFVLTIHQALNRSELEKIAGRICDAVMEESYRFGQNEIYISVTAGIVLNTSGETHKELLIRAGLALKAAKKLQLRRMVYSNDMDAVRMYEYNVRWTKKIKKAIEQDRIVPFFQPIVDTETGRIGKYECLVRMVDSDAMQSVISPGDFLPVAREARSYRFITRIMLEKSFARFKNESVEFSVNLSVEDILDRTTNELIERLLQENSGTASRCIFELVETAEFESYEPVVDFINKVHHYGTKIAIDDFGTGYSNFSHIMSLPVDFIKIDGSLIQDLDCKDSVKKIVKTINGFAHKMGIRTVAEFVHSESVYKVCRSIGIDYCQGFFFGRPLEDLKS